MNALTSRVNRHERCRAKVCKLPVLGTHCTRDGEVLGALENGATVYRRKAACISLAAMSTYSVIVKLQYFWLCTPCAICNFSFSALAAAWCSQCFRMVPIASLRKPLAFIWPQS